MEGVEGRYLKTPVGKPSRRGAKSLKYKGKSIPLVVSKGVGLTPAQISKIRADIAHAVDTVLPQAIEVLHGKRDWKVSQVQLFKTLLNKAVPDISENYHVHDVTMRNLSELSQEDLMRIAGMAEHCPMEAGEGSKKASKIKDLAEIGGEYTVIDDDEEAESEPEEAENGASAD